MANHDWEKFGEDIKKVVQDAIDSQDFDKLNQTITNTITNAADAIAKNMKNTGNKSGYRQEYGPDRSLVRDCIVGQAIPGQADWLWQ